MYMKVTTTRSKSSETFYICHSFVDKNGKNTSRVHKRLGTLAELSLLLSTDRDGVMAWAKEQARIATDDYNKENQAVSVLLSPTHYIPKMSSALLTADTFSFNLSFLLSALIISAVISKDAISMNTIFMIFFPICFLHGSFILPVRKTLTLLLRRSWNSPNTFSKTSIAPFLLLPMNQIISRLRSIVIHISFINGIPRSFIMTVQTIILK